MRIAVLACIALLSALTAVAQDQPRPRIVVQGEVRHPGAYPADTANTVLKVITAAGGLMPDSNLVA